MPSRDFVDGEIEKIRHCVIPICGEDVHKRPCLLGSAVLIRLGSADVLVTAAHVLSDNDGVPLFVFGADGFGHWLTGEFTLDTKEDLAALCLAPEMSAKLSHVSPLPVALVAEITEQRFYGTVVGYPASSSKRPQKGYLHTPMEAYSNIGTKLVGGRISIAFDWKSGAFASNTGHGKARKPTGKSGGAIFAFRTLGINGVLPMAGPKLVGIATRWKRNENRIEGAGPAALGRILAAAISDVT